MTQSQATQLTPGQFWEMAKALVDRLPKEGTDYHQDPAWFNRQVAGLVKLDRHANDARLIEALLAGDVETSAIEELLRHIVNQYESQEVKPRLFYPQDYALNSINEQVGLLLVAYPWLDTSNVATLVASWDLAKYPQADGLYVDCNPVTLANHLGVELGDDWENFGSLIEQGPLAALARIRPKFINYRSGQMGPDRYRLSQPTKDALRLLVKEQPGDLLVSPGQTGNLHAGKSVRNSRWHIEHAATPNQWPWSAYTAGHSLIGNPHRLEAADEHLAIDCPGDEFSWYADGEFDSALCFNFNEGRLYLSRRLVGDAYGRFGSASGFSGQ